MMCEIPLALSRITMLHTLKHRSWDKSLSLPCAHVHSFAQNVLLHMVEENHMQHLNTMHAFTRKHLCRVFPSWFVLQSKNFTNYDPVLAWTMGCQIVSMNLQSTDESLLVADGRFRQNGSCGYVLKAPYMLDSSAKNEESQHWKFNVLSGFKLLKPSGGRKQASVVNPFVRISLYEGSSKAKRIMYNTKRVKQNGLNPIWKEDEVFEFAISNPSVAMLVFSIWDKTDDGTEDFIAASSLPVSCIREGYRSVALFDAKHTRSGPYAFSSLLIKAAKRPAPLK
jgi:phosphatidylinositol phospholipase C delta